MFSNVLKLSYFGELRNIRLFHQDYQTFFKTQEIFHSFNISLSKFEVVIFRAYKASAGQSTLERAVLNILKASLSLSLSLSLFLLVIRIHELTTKSRNSSGADRSPFSLLSMPNWYEKEEKKNQGKQNAANYWN